MAAKEVTAAQYDPALGLDLAAVRRWITSLGVEIQGRLDFERIGFGKSNLTIDVRDQGSGRWILRRPPLGELLDSAHDVAREARILSALRDSAVPVPAVISLCQDTSVSSAPLLLMEYVDGLVIDRMNVAESVNDGMRRALSDSMAGTLASIHQVDLDASGLAGLASHQHYGERQLRRWSAQWESAKTRELPALDELTAILRRSIPAQQETVLVHGDFHLRNIICSPETGTVRAVLDWELATLGDPIADLGSLLAYWPQKGDPPTPLFAASALPGFKTREELTTAYLAATGRDGSALTFWQVLGLWKIAIIMEGVLRRALNEPLNADADGAPDPTVVDQLVDRAFRTLSAGGLPRRATHG